MHGQEYVMKMKAAGSLGPVVVNSSAGKESAYNAGDTGNSGLIPGSGRFSRKGNGNPHDGHDFLHIISGLLTTLG